MKYYDLNNGETLPGIMNRTDVEAAFQGMGVVCISNYIKPQ